MAANIDWEQYAADKQSDQEDDSKIDWEQYAAPSKIKSSSNVNIANWPEGIKSALGLLQSASMPLNKAVPLRLQAAKRGITDLGQGIKQLYLGGKEALGAAPEGSQDEYTKQSDLDRAAYNQTPAGQDPYSQMIRGGVKSSPWLALGGPLGARSILSKILGGGAVGGTIGASEYVPTGEDRGGNILKSATLGAGGAILPEIPDLALTAGEKIGNLRNAFKNLSPLEKKFAEAQEKLQADQAALKSAQGAAQSSGISGNPNMAQAQSFKQQSNLQNQYESLNEDPSIISSLPEHSFAELERSKSNIDNAKSQIEDANLEHEKAIDFVNQNEKDISNHLNQGAAHDVRTARRVKEMEKANRQQISSGYDALEKDFSDKNVVIDNTEAIKQKNKDLMDLIKSGEHRSPEATKIIEDLDKLTDTTSINAKDYLRAYRSASQFAREARQKSYQPGMNAEERNEWHQKYKELDDKVQEMGETLEDSVGSQDFGRLKELNSRWKNEVVPLYKNTIFQNISKKSQMPSNIMNSLRGDEPGNVLIKNMIKSDPESLKNVVGQRYANKPDALHNANEIEKEYIDQMPELQNLLQNHAESKSAASMAENKINEAELAHKEAKKLHEQITDEHENLIKQSEKRSAKRQEIDDTHDKLALLDKHVSNLRAVANRKSLSLKEKMKVEKDLKDAIELKNKATRRLVLLGGIGASAAGGATAYKVGKYLLSDHGTNY